VHPAPATGSMEVSSPASRPSPPCGLRPALTPAAGTTPRQLPGAAANNFTTRSLQLKSPRNQGRPATPPLVSSEEDVVVVTTYHGGGGVTSCCCGACVLRRRCRVSSLLLSLCLLPVLPRCSSRGAVCSSAALTTVIAAGRPQLQCWRRGFRWQAARQESASSRHCSSASSAELRAFPWASRLRERVTPLPRAW